MGPLTNIPVHFQMNFFDILCCNLMSLIIFPFIDMGEKPWRVRFQVLKLMFAVQSCFLECTLEIQSRQLDGQIVIMKHLTFVFD